MKMYKISNKPQTNLKIYYKDWKSADEVKINYNSITILIDKYGIT